MEPADLTESNSAGRWGFFAPPAAGADLRAALVASCLRGAFPPVDLRAVCLVRAMVGYNNMFGVGDVSMNSYLFL